MGTYSLTRERRVEKASGWMDRMAFQLRSLWTESVIGEDGGMWRSHCSQPELSLPSDFPPVAVTLAFRGRYLQLPGFHPGYGIRNRDIAAWL